MLTDKTHVIENECVSETDNENDSDESTDQVKEDKSQVPLPTVLHNIDEPEITSEQVVNIAPGEGRIPVSTYSEPNWEALAFVKQYSEGKFNYNIDRKVRITPSKYIHARLKCCDHRCAADPQYIFQCLNWIERETITLYYNSMLPSNL